MSPATATRQRRKKASSKGQAKRKKPAAAAASSAPVAHKPAGKGAAPGAAPGERPKPKMRASPPPVDLEIDPEVLDFIKAIDDYRAAHDRPFPTWSEVLYVLKRLGYRRA